MSGSPSGRAQRIVVVGSGAFGTALAAVLAATGRHDVVLLTRRESLLEDFKDTGRNDDALPGIDLPQTLRMTIDETMVATADIVLLAVPSQAQREVARSLSGFITEQTRVVICAKGLEGSSGALLTDVVASELHAGAVCVLSGPGFAADIAKGLPTAMTLAAPDATAAEELAEMLSGATFRLYPSDDRIGVQLGGALKNVLAIACGIVEGAGLGDSARAALISRGLAEMSRLVAAQGGAADTVRGLSGLGDLVLTATSHQSRNLRYGIALGHTSRASSQSVELVEGAFAAGVAAGLAEALEIDMPITRAVSDIINGHMDVKTAIGKLMSRPITQE